MLGMLKEVIVAEEKGETSPHLPRVKERLEKDKKNLGKKISIEQLQEICQIKEKISKLKFAKESQERKIKQEIESLKTIINSSSESEAEKEIS